MNNCEPTILYEDGDLVVVSKPSGMIVHPVSGEEKTTGPILSEWLVSRYPELSSVGEEETAGDGSVISRPGIVHRLDRDTSGVIVIARTGEAYAALKKQFSEREIRKVYRAFVYGAVAEPRFSVDRPIGRARGSGNARSIRDAHGTLREAQTIFRTLGTGSDESTPVSYIEAFPKTGRTHQIRVHLSFVHHPIVCDPIYAPSRPPLLGFSRLALHALSLSFLHPRTGEDISFSAPLPPDFVEAEHRLVSSA